MMLRFQPGKDTLGPGWCFEGSGLQAPLVLPKEI